MCKENRIELREAVFDVILLLQLCSVVIKGEVHAIVRVTQQIMRHKMRVGTLIVKKVGIQEHVKIFGAEQSTLRHRHCAPSTVK